MEEGEQVTLLHWGNAFVEARLVGRKSYGTWVRPFSSLTARV